jgi:hypothetical protein
MGTRRFACALAATALCWCLAIPGAALAMPALPEITSQEWSVRGPGGNYGILIQKFAGRTDAIYLVLASKDLLPMKPRALGLASVAAVGAVIASLVLVRSGRKSPA